jgi:hypothetical protein
MKLGATLIVGSLSSYFKPFNYEAERLSVISCEQINATDCE